MKKKLSKMIDRTFIVYLIIGILNFLFCTALMFVLFNLCGFSDDTAPLVNYGLGSVIWFFAGKYIIFPGQKTSVQQVVRFALEVIACYLLSYYIIARIAGFYLLQSASVRQLFSFGGTEPEMIAGNLQMTVGTVAYAIINYFGQRFFVFSSRFELHKKEENKTTD